MSPPDPSHPTRVEPSSSYLSVSVDLLSRRWTCHQSSTGPVYADLSPVFSVAHGFAVITPPAMLRTPTPSALCCCCLWWAKNPHFILPKPTLTCRGLWLICTVFFFCELIATFCLRIIRLTGLRGHSWSTYAEFPQFWPPTCICKHHHIVLLATSNGIAKSRLFVVYCVNFEQYYTDHFDCCHCCYRKQTKVIYRWSWYYNPIT